MLPKFAAEIQQLQDFTYVKLSGTIDEDNELAPLGSRIRGRTAIIDLAGVQDINNCGVRDWVNCLEGLQDREINVVLVECSPAIVAKLNTVSNFIEKGFVKSFYVPYFCQACEMEKAMLVDMDELRGEWPVKTPTCRCDSCDGIMAFDDLEETYFRFVKDARKAIPPEEVKGLLQQLSPAPGERKIVSNPRMGESSFTGIPSTASMADQFSTGVGSASVPSAASLRRLRDKTGLKAMRPSSADAADKKPQQAGGRRLLLAGTLALLLFALALVLAFGLK